MSWKDSLVKEHILPWFVNLDLFFPIYQPPDYLYRPRAKGTRSHHFFQALKPGKIFFKGLQKLSWGFGKHHKIVSRPFDCAIFRKLTVFFQSTFLTMGQRLPCPHWCVKYVQWKTSVQHPKQIHFNLSNSQQQEKKWLKRERFSQYLCCCFFPKGAFILPFKQKFVFKSVAS